MRLTSLRPRITPTIDYLCALSSATLILSPSTELSGFWPVFVLSWIGKDVLAGRLSFGVFGLYLGSLFSLIRPLKKLSQVNSINQQALGRQ